MFKKIYKLHTYVGLLVAFHFLIFAITGLILLFEDELKSSLFATENKVRAEVLSREQLADGYLRFETEAKKQFPNEKLIALYPSDTNPSLLNARMSVSGTMKLRGSHKLTLNLQSPTEVTQDTNYFFKTILELHREFFLGSWGRIYIGFIGLLYVFMLLSGMYLYGKFMKGRSFTQIRATEVLKNLDYHKFFGSVTFGWGLVVGITGVFLALNSTLIKVFQYQTLTHLNQEFTTTETHNDSVAPLKNIIETALKAKSDSKISYIAFPDTEYGLPGKFVFLMSGNTPQTERLSEVLVIDSFQAQLIKIVDLPWYLKFAILSGPLHFGNYGGKILKIIWSVFALSSLGVVLLGLSAFFKKRIFRIKESDKLSINRSTISKNVKNPYKLPALLAVVTITSLSTALFANGIWVKLALIPLLLPLIYLTLARVSKNE